MSHGRRHRRLRSTVSGAVVQRRSIPHEERVAASAERSENRIEVRIWRTVVRFGRAQANGAHVGHVCRGLFVVVAAQPIAGRRRRRRRQRCQ